MLVGLFYHLVAVDESGALVNFATNLTVLNGFVVSFCLL